MRRSGPFPSALFLAVVASVVVDGQHATASEGHHGSAPKAAARVPYLSMGLAVVRSERARYVDGDDSGEAALYGNEGLYDAGAFDSGVQFRLAAGIRLPSGLRTQVEVGLPGAFDWRGNANYRNAGEHQPSEATLDAWQLVLAGFYDFRGWKLGWGETARPYLGAGAGVGGYRLSGYSQRFPDPDDPAGYLRRGPEGEIPFTGVPSGKGRRFIWTLTAGIGVAVRETVHLDLSYRYTCMGEIETDVDDVTIVRYRADGSRREIMVPINETTVDHRTHTLVMDLRLEV